MADLAFDINSFNTSGRYDLQIVSDVTGGTGGAPFKRNITSVEFDVDNTKVWEVPSILYIPKNVCAGVDYVGAGWTLSATNSDYAKFDRDHELIHVTGSDVRSYVISKDQYDALIAEDQANYRAMPLLTPATEWAYTYSEGSSDSTNVSLNNGLYGVTSFSPNQLQIICDYLIGQLKYGGSRGQNANEGDIKVGDLTKTQNGTTQTETLYFAYSSIPYQALFGGIDAQVVDGDAINVFVRACKNPIGISPSASNLNSVFSDSSNDYFNSYSFQCPSTIFGNATSSAFTEETFRDPGTGQEQGTGKFYYTGEMVYFDYNAPTPIDPTPADPTPTATSEYVLCIDGVPIDLSLFSDVDGDVVLSLDKGSVHTATMVDTTTGQTSTSATWRVNNNDNDSLPSGFSVSEGVLTIATSAASGRYHIEGTAEESAGSVDIYLPASGITVADAGLGVGIALGTSGEGYIAFIDSTGDYKTTSNGNANSPVSLVSKDGLTITQDANTGVYNITVPYDSVGYGFCVLDRNDIDGDQDMVVDAKDGFANESSNKYSVMWGVTFPDARRATPRWRSWVLGSDAGTYELTAFICGGNLAGGSDENTKWVQIVNSIRLTIQPIINVSWIAVSYEG